jgi:hypothetical protein
MALPSVRKGYDPFINVPQPIVEDGTPKRIPVLVREKVLGGAEGEGRFLYGYIVTHLDVRDYCELHGLDLIQVMMGTREALPHEKTELF